MQTEEEILDEHPLELEEIKAGLADRRPDPATLRKRQLIFFSIAALMTTANLFCLIFLSRHCLGDG